MAASRARLTGPAQLRPAPRSRAGIRGPYVTYANPVFVSAEGRLHLFFRSGVCQGFLVSDDDGRIRSRSGVLFAQPGQAHIEDAVEWPGDHAYAGLSSRPVRVVAR